ncbi:DNA-binding protein RFX6 [Caerostris extrusa]|uniref:DNA-binding protein RFX6 n=1 Tax=Caerostris extrusa TaxID=172846 RepID=A0AAV4NZJ9_CAEEX|nr:DNA-binding protein RFX6 [Caerostris extrusa]
MKTIKWLRANYCSCPELIRNTFPEVTSKRLGARGHSKFSIGISSKNEQTFPKKFSLASKVGMLLPNFPEAADLIIPNSELIEKIGVFLTMYRMHCQCIVDVAISGNFEEWSALAKCVKNAKELPLIADRDIMNYYLVWLGPLGLRFLYEEGFVIWRKVGTGE